jgi:hypothetical protein
MCFEKELFVCLSVCLKRHRTAFVKSKYFYLNYESIPNIQSELWQLTLLVIFAKTVENGLSGFD